MQNGYSLRAPSAFGALVVAFLLVVPSLGAQQGSTVTGRVLDPGTGTPIPAVQVFISALDLGSLTQQNGRYLLQNVPAGTHTLGAARIGYRTAEVQITVGGGQTVEQNFAMTEEALQLDEIIVTGTPGGMQRRAIGNTVASVDVGDIVANVAITNFQDLLSGRTTGLQFTSLSGNVGTGTAIRIRGTGSFTLGVQPLIYVDGVRVNNDTGAGPTLGGGDNVSVLDDFNPEDIESVEIIKGPSAASLYGTEASAGVIQIITKKGAVGAPQFNASIRQGINFMTDPAGRLGDMWTCPTAFLPGAENYGDGPGGLTGNCQTQAELVRYNMYDEGTRYIAMGAENGGFDWPTPNLYQNGYAQAYNVDVRGGTAAVRYFVSANYEDEEGFVWYNTDETFRLRANVNVLLSDAFSLDVSTGYVDGYTRFAAPTVADGGIWQDLIWSNGHFLERVNSAASGRGNARLKGFQEHLPTDVADVEATRDYTRFTGSATLRHNADLGGVVALSQRLVVGIDKGWDTNRNLFPVEAGHLDVDGIPQSVYEETDTGEMTYERPIATNLSFDYSITGDYDLNEDFNFGTSFGAQYYNSTNELFSNQGNGFASPLSRTINQLATDQVRTTFELFEQVSLGLYVQEQISYQDRIFLTGSLRFDDNSTFGVNAPSRKYPNVQGMWVLSEESFWNFDAVNSFRVRGAWGKAGRQPDADSQTNLFTVISGPSGASAIRADSPGNPAIEAEVSTETEVGADFALFDDRLSGEFTYYDRTDDKVLLAKPALSSEGVPGEIQTNLGRIDSWGWEASLNIGIYQSQSFSFDLYLAADHTMNEIKALGAFPADRGDGIAIGLPYPNQTDPDLIVEASFDPAGERTNAFGRGMTATCDEGLNQAPAGVTDPLELDQYGLKAGGAAVPCASIPNQQINLGPNFFPYTFRVAPRVSLFGNALQLTAMAEGKYGKWTDENGMEWGHRYANSLASRLLDDPVFSYGMAIGSNSVRRLYLNDFWKLREISARYTLPESMVARFGVERASIAVSARNLFILYRSQDKITGAQISDPEYGSNGGTDGVTGSGAGNFQDGGDGNYWEVPPLSSLNLTLRITF